MNNQKIIDVSKRLAAVINKQFPYIFECDAREAAAKMLFNLHFETEIAGKLFDDGDDLV